MTYRNEEDWTTFTIFNDDLKLIGFHVFLSKDQNFLSQYLKIFTLPPPVEPKIINLKKKKTDFLICRYDKTENY